MTTAEETALNITLTGSDVDGNPLTYSVVANPAHGTLTGTAPNLTYTPGTNYNGSDTFTFKVNDGTLDSATVTVTIAVTPDNDAPVVSGAVNLGYSVEDLPVLITASQLLANTTDVDSSSLTGGRSERASGSGYD